MKRTILIYTLCILFGVASQAHSESRNAASAFLTQVGIKHILEGNTADALHEFSKALMLDPTNEEAKSYLREFGLKEGLYPGSKTHLTQMADLARQIYDCKHFGCAQSDQAEKPQVIYVRAVEPPVQYVVQYPAQDITVTHSVEAHSKLVNQDSGDKNAIISYMLDAQEKKIELEALQEKYKDLESERRELYATNQSQDIQVSGLLKEVERISTDLKSVTDEHNRQMTQQQAKYNSLKSQNEQKAKVVSHLEYKINEYALKSKNREYELTGEQVGSTKKDKHLLKTMDELIELHDYFQDSLQREIY